MSLSLFQGPDFRLPDLANLQLAFERRIIGISQSIIYFFENFMCTCPFIETIDLSRHRVDHLHHPLWFFLGIPDFGHHLFSFWDFFDRQWETTDIIRYRN